MPTVDFTRTRLIPWWVICGMGLDGLVHIKDILRYIDLRGRDNLLWYVSSLETADVEHGLPPSPYDREAGNFWTAAYNDVMSGKKSAQVALAEANRQLNAKIQEAESRK